MFHNNYYAIQFIRSNIDNFNKNIRHFVENETYSNIQQ